MSRKCSRWKKFAEYCASSCRKMDCEWPIRDCHAPAEYARNDVFRVVSPRPERPQIFKQAIPTFSWLRVRAFCCSLARPKVRPSILGSLTCNVAHSITSAKPRCVTGCGLHINADIPANGTHMNAAPICLGAEGVP